MKKVFLVIGVAVIGVMFGSSDILASGGKALDPPGPGVVEPGEEIVIGGTFTLTGPVSHAGRMTLEGAERAVKNVNEELGGILGHKVKLKYYDDEFQEAKITMLYEKLITRDKVDLLISPYTSPCVNESETLTP